MQNFLLFFVILFVTSCISSQYPAGEPKEQITDDKIVGTWIFQENKNFNIKNNPSVQVISMLVIGYKDKNYTFQTLNEIDGQTLGEPDKMLIHKIQGENFISVYKTEEGSKGKYYYSKYKIEGNKLTIYPILETKALKLKSLKDYDPASDETPATEFANEKLFRALIAKNVKGLNQNIKLQEPFVFTKK